MARSFLAVLTALLPLAFAGADPTPTPPAAPPTPEGMSGKSPSNEQRHRKGKDRDGDRDDSKRSKDDDDGPGKRFKKRLQEMSPEEREHFRQNWQRWKEMAGGEQKDWKQRALAERERMKKVIDDAIASVDLKLSADQREVFVLRYRQERRRVEEELHAEFETKRNEKMKAVLEQLKREFSSPATPTPAPAP
jgi:hypothetical protein